MKSNKYSGWTLAQLIANPPRARGTYPSEDELRSEAEFLRDRYRREAILDGITAGMRAVSSGPVTGEIMVTGEGWRTILLPCARYRQVADGMVAGLRALGGA